MSGGTQGSRGSAGQSLAPTWDPALGTEGEAKAATPSLPRRDSGRSPSHPCRRLLTHPRSPPDFWSPPRTYPLPFKAEPVKGPVKWSHSTRLAASRLGEMRVLSSFTLRCHRRRGGPRSPGINRTPRPKKAHSVQLTTPSLALPSWPVQPGLVPCGNGGAAGRGSEAEGNHGESR